MPIRVRVRQRAERQEPGPRPFSQEWLALPSEERAPPPRRIPVLPLWVPSDRVLAAIMVLLLVLATVIVSGGPAPRTTAFIAAPAGIADQSGGNTALATSSPVAQTDAAPSERVISENDPATAADDARENGLQDDPRALLPRYRVLSYYGHPASEQMGILGEFDQEELLNQLMDEVAAYEAADPSRPVMPAFELIASVAQDWPADNNTYLLHTGPNTIQSYVDFTREQGIILILDLQIGHSTIEAEIDAVREWLEEPHVHLALDPEFSMPEGKVPGTVIGGLDAADVAVAQQELAMIVAEHDLPPKMLIVHQFTENMIRNADQIVQVAGVQTIIEFDGFGDPANKIAGYDLFINQPYVRYGGVKLFYQQDEPLMTPDDIVSLDPPPDLVIYQ